MSAFYPSLTLGVKLRNINGLPVVKIYTYGFQELFLKFKTKRKTYTYIKYFDINHVN